MTIKTVILDLDGPVLDGRLRHYACYREALVASGHKPLSLPKYWILKRTGLGGREQLKACNAEKHYAEFSRRWLQEIESEAMLRLDVVHVGVRAKLSRWRKAGVRIILATLRQHPERLETQLKRLDVLRYFDDISVTKHGLGATGKAQGVLALLNPFVPEESLWIGDTEIDLAAARHLHCRCLLVTGGVRSAAYLKKCQPDFLRASLKEVDLERL
jgi:phosphoglycolate phosphatase